MEVRRDVGSAIVPILLDNTPLPSELTSVHAISLHDLVQAEGVSRLLQPLIKHLQYSKMIGVLAVVLAAATTLFTILFLFPVSGIASLLVVGLALLIAFGCLLFSIRLFRFAYRWTKVKERLTAEVIHGLKSEVRSLSAMKKDNAIHDRSLRPRHLNVILESAEYRELPPGVDFTLMEAINKTEHELREARAVAQAEIRGQWLQQKREEADRRGVVKAKRFPEGDVQCPECSKIFSIERMEKPRCPRCQTLVE